MPHNMQLERFIFCLMFSTNTFAQTAGSDQPLPAVLIPANTFEYFPKYTNNTQMVSSYFVEEGRTHVNIIVDTPKACPLEYVNVSSNTNLFTIAEQELLKAIRLDYNSVTTNSGPPHSVFVRLETLMWHMTATYEVALFRFTNAAAHAQVFFDNRGAINPAWARFRTEAGDGFDVRFGNHGIGAFRQFKHGQLNGLWADFESDRCSAWMRFTNGKALGKWLVWNREGSLYMEAEFKEPFDFLRYLSYASR